MTWEKLPALEGSMACLTCGAGARSDLQMDRLICVGFGSAGYMKDDKVLWDEQEVDQGVGDDSIPSVEDVEGLARDDPDHDWRIYFHAPLYEAEYQRQGDGIWVLVRKGQGFA